MVVPIKAEAEPKRQKAGKHFRLPWVKADPREVLVHCSWQELKGTYKVSERDAPVKQARYEAAKRRFDHAAAAEIVGELISDAIIDRVIDALITTNMPPLIVVPHPEYDPDEPKSSPLPITNALPFAIAGRLAAELDCEIDKEIIEVARPGRTALNRFQRFLWQPRFQGAVRSDRAYILADDTCTLGGTFAALRHHIVEQGGTVIAVTALSLGNGDCVPFPIADRTKGVLLSKYGPELSTLWREEIGHDEQSLTEGEGAFLVDWAEKEHPGRDQSALLQRLRDRLAQAAGNGG
ncbi:hypothetical protein SAMN02983003_3863 [Devosia enhydra]|uniref:Phosphoribosyl transferase domain-containing protein n=1 Tax=Devosia enhydra TaxID=665118 RepID=A0A1K2I2R8_9HYPH|nr:phosphoribosyltransferase [Devosia enhydra]SFZ86669.1 hypothetical protein SAMN02983003_3863 [Devosia enhydra]